MPRVELFEVVPTDAACQDLRRFVTSDTGKCSGRFGYHSATVELHETCVLPLVDEKGHRYDGYGMDDAPHDDPRWPRACDCGYVFQEADTWQHNVHRLWRRADESPDAGLFPTRLFTYLHGRHNAVLGSTHACGARLAPPGALRDCPWYHDTGWKGSDGRSAEVVLPDGVTWNIDVPSRDNRPWDRTGTWPKITARPSILTPTYHGFLTDGVLVDC